MRLELINKLPFADVSVGYRGTSIAISRVLIDTGSASTILAADAVAALGIFPQSDDPLYLIRGVGGTEVVFARRVDFLHLGDGMVRDFFVEVGGMDYGFPINGILGMDFLLQSGAMIDLRNCTIDFSLVNAPTP
jgi:predicted aspartyl protease